MILDAGRTPSRVAPPDWAWVQRKVQDNDFLTKVLNYDLELLRAAPQLTSFLVAEYFRKESGANASPGRPSSRCSSTTRRRPSPYSRYSGGARGSSPARPSSRHSSGPRGSSPSPLPPEPLSFSRVHRANRAAAALMRWCVEVIEAVQASPETTEVEVSPSEIEDKVAPLEVDVLAQGPEKSPPPSPPKRSGSRYNFAYDFDKERPSTPPFGWPAKLPHSQMSSHAKYPPRPACGSWGTTSATLCLQDAQRMIHQASAGRLGKPGPLCVTGGLVAAC